MRRLARSTSFGTTLGPEGFAANVTGGAGGTVFAVTNGNDAGPGSLRQAVANANANSPNPSIIDVQVGGFITVNSRVSIDASNVTFTGANAPAPFVIRGMIPSFGGNWWNGPAIDLNGSNVLMEHIRIHRGLGQPTGNTGNTKNMFVFGTDTLVRHCSFAWGEDVCVATWQARRVTFQYCLFYEALAHAHHREGGKFITHPMMVNLTQPSPNAPYQARQNILHSAAAHANERHGWKQDLGDIEIVNVLTYNWGSSLQGITTRDLSPGGPTPTNWLGCMWISGNDYQAGSFPARTGTNPDQQVWVEDPLWLKPGWVEERTPANIFRVGSPAPSRHVWNPPEPVPVTQFPVDEMWFHLRPRIGAIKPRRSKSDIRILKQLDDAVRRLSIDGTIKDSPTATDGNQNPAATTSYVANWGEVL